MTHEEHLTMDRQRLAAAWQHALAARLHVTDQIEVRADELHPQAIHIWIKTMGREIYTFDFKCTYIDEHEVTVELADVAEDQVSIDEHREAIQLMIKGYVQQIHKCAQELQALTDEQRR